MILSKDGPALNIHECILCAEELALGEADMDSGGHANLRRGRKMHMYTHTGQHDVWKEGKRMNMGGGAECSLHSRSSVNTLTLMGPEDERKAC